MAAEDNWQTELPTLVERTAFIFNNEILSDVKFVVPVSTGESESKKVIPAHKFVLAISSPVFFAMFYGQMAETKDSIELPDCDYESLLELFRFLYTDIVNLSGSNVMQVLYLANKYMVPSLSEKCAEYLRDNLKVSNVFLILPHAQKYEDKDLEDRCWEVIKKQTEEAVMSDGFVTVERSVVESVVKREKLIVTELELFKAVDRWATAEVQRQGFSPDGKTKRRILGEDVVKAIRFPLISQKDFMSVVFDADILTFHEVGNMMKHYSGVLKYPLLFKDTARSLLFRFNRFPKFFPPAHKRGIWSYSGGTDSIEFTTNKPILLHGVQYFGSDGGKYTVSTKVKVSAHDSCLGKESGTYSSIKEETNNYYGFDVMFDPPIRLEAHESYRLVSLIKGPLSWHGEEGVTSFESKGVLVNFMKSAESANGTSETSGQFPAFIFSTCQA